MLTRGTFFINSYQKKPVSLGVKYPLLKTIDKDSGAMSPPASQY